METKQQGLQPVPQYGMPALQAAVGVSVCLFCFFNINAGGGFNVLCHNTVHLPPKIIFSACMLKSKIIWKANLFFFQLFFSLPHLWLFMGGKGDKWRRLRWYLKAGRGITRDSLGWLQEHSWSSPLGVLEEQNGYYCSANMYRLCLAGPSCSSRRQYILRQKLQTAVDLWKASLGHEF